MQKLNFFDCNCSVGRVAYPHLHDIPDVEGLLQEIDDFMKVIKKFDWYARFSTAQLPGRPV